jgi:hypothetical protein
LGGNIGASNNQITCANNQTNLIHNQQYAQNAGYGLATYTSANKINLKGETNGTTEQN